MPEPVTQRIVPGAPPPAPISKSAKKKRRAKGKAEHEDTPAGAEAASAARTEASPEAVEVKETIPVPEQIAESDSQGIPIPEEDLLLKLSPIVDLVQKRLKVTTKKIGRITVYAATDPEKLNDDQKRTIKTLPTLEAVQKELGEVKKAIEVHEAELVQELAIKRLEAEKAEKARIHGAVSAAQAALVTKTNSILDLLRLRSSLASGAIDISGITEPSEVAALFSVADALVGEDSESKQATVNNIFFGQDVHGISSSRLLEFVDLAFNPPRPPTPEPVEETEQLLTLEESIVHVEAEVPITVVSTATVSGSFRFIQDSEIEAETTSFDEGVWVEKSDAAGHEEPVVNGHVEVAEVATPAAVAPIDWAADDEGGLPSIAGLHAEFGTSGSATPAEAHEEAAAPEVNGHAAEEPSPQAAPEDDGFTQARGGRGRGGRGGFRGGERGGPRGGHRGGERGGIRGGRGGERGGFRGERHERGERGERGGRGGGGERGSFRGFRGSGERGGGAGRGEWRGEGERRGRGRGRGGPPGAPPPPAAAAAVPQV